MRRPARRFHALHGARWHPLPGEAGGRFQVSARRRTSRAA